MDMVFIDGLSFALPLLVMAIAAIYSEKSGVINLAIEGLQGFGAFIGALAAILLTHFTKGSSAPWIMYLALFSAMLGGMVYAMLHATLCVKFHANQVISGVVTNILSLALTGFLTSVINQIITGQASNKFMIGVSPRFDVPYLKEIPVVGALFKSMYPFEIIILVVVIIAWYILYKTGYGMHLRACGENPHAVDAAGGNVGRTRFIAVMISGALAGLGGMCIAYSISAQFSPTIYMGYGYLAIAAMIFGNWRIIPTSLACFFFGFTRSGGYKLCLVLGLSSNVSELLMMLPYILTLLLLIFFSKNTHAPAAGGQPFDKGKR